MYLLPTSSSTMETCALQEVSKTRWTPQSEDKNRVVFWSHSCRSTQFLATMDLVQVCTLQATSRCKIGTRVRTSIKNHCTTSSCQRQAWKRMTINPYRYSPTTKWGPPTGASYQSVQTQTLISWPLATTWTSILEWSRQLPPTRENQLASQARAPETNLKCWGPNLKTKRGSQAQGQLRNKTSLSVWVLSRLETIHNLTWCRSLRRKIPPSRRSLQSWLTRIATLTATPASRRARIKPRIAAWEYRNLRVVQDRATKAIHSWVTHPQFPIASPMQLRASRTSIATIKAR